MAPSYGPSAGENARCELGEGDASSLTAPHIPTSSPRNGYAVVARGAARLRGVSKDGHGHPRCGHPSRLAAKCGEHLRMTAVLERRSKSRAQRIGILDHIWPA